MRTVSLLIASFLSVSQGVNYLEPQWNSGRSTWYHTWDTVEGNCGFHDIPTASFPFGYIVAPNEAFYDNSTACGQCYEVRCVDVWEQTTQGCCNTDSTVIVQVTDRCPILGNAQWCSGDVVHFDLSDDAFAVIADPVCGVIEMEYRRVSCEFNGNAYVKNHNGANQWWYAVVIKNVNDYGDISLVEMRDSSSAQWLTGVRQQWNGWLFEGDFSTPLDIRVTDSIGRVIEALDVVTSFDGTTDVAIVEFDLGQNYALSSVATPDPVTTDTAVVSQSWCCDILSDGSNVCTGDCPVNACDILSPEPLPTDQPTKRPTNIPTDRPTRVPTDPPTPCLGRHADCSAGTTLPCCAGFSCHSKKEWCS